MAGAAMFPGAPVRSPTCRQGCIPAQFCYFCFTERSTVNLLDHPAPSLSSSIGGEWARNGESIARCRRSTPSFISPRPPSPPTISSTSSGSPVPTSPPASRSCRATESSAGPYRGDRRDHFTAETDLWEMLNRIAPRGSARDRPTVALLAELSARLEKDESAPRHVRERSLEFTSSSPLSAIGTSRCEPAKRPWSPMKLAQVRPLHPGRRRLASNMERQPSESIHLYAGYLQFFTETTKRKELNMVELAYGLYLPHHLASRSGWPALVAQRQGLPGPVFRHNEELAIRPTICWWSGSTWSTSASSP